MTIASRQVTIKSGDTMLTRLQVCISDCLDPYENLALEKQLFDTVENDCCILYLWQNKDTVVIGKNQNPWAECKCSLLEEEGIRLARRLSGGGAVFHDLGNLNFTFICHSENYDLARQMSVIANACSLAGIDTELSGRNDILANGRKFSGNAFYKSNGRSYHHGTILIDADTERMSRYLTPSTAKLEAKGVKSVRSRVVNLKEFSPTLTVDKMKQNMILAFGKVYQLEPIVINTIDKTSVSLKAAEFQSWKFVYGTPIPCTLSCEKRFDLGTINLRLQIKSGVIEALEVYTDAMDHELPDKIKAAILGVAFDRGSVLAALTEKLPADYTKAISELLQNELSLKNT